MFGARAFESQPERVGIQPSTKTLDISPSLNSEVPPLSSSSLRTSPSERLPPSEFEAGFEPRGYLRAWLSTDHDGAIVTFRDASCKRLGLRIHTGYLPRKIPDSCEEGARLQAGTAV